MTSRERRPNLSLRHARGAMSQERLADLANQEILRTTGRVGAVSAKSVSDWERGWYTWPARPTRDALCVVLGVEDPAALGFRPRQAAGNGQHGDTPASAVIIGLDVQEQVDPMRRRTFLLGGAAALSAVPVAPGRKAAKRIVVRSEDEHGFATATSERWPSTVLCRSVPDDGADWRLRLPAGHLLSGADVATQVHATVGAAGRSVLVRPERRRFDQFTRPVQRGLLVAADTATEGGTYYAADAHEAARQLAGQSDRLTVTVPRAYALDDLTYGALWAMTSLDETLLSDDALLHAARQDLAHYDGLPGSTVAEGQTGDLSTVSQLWLRSTIELQGDSRSCQCPLGN